MYWLKTFFVLIITILLLGGCSFGIPQEIQKTATEVTEKSKEIYAETKDAAKEIAAELDEAKDTAEKKVDEITTAIDAVNKVFESEQNPQEKEIQE